MWPPTSSGWSVDFPNLDWRSSGWSFNILHHSSGPRIEGQSSGEEIYLVVNCITISQHWWQMCRLFIKSKKRLNSSVWDKALQPFGHFLQNPEIGRIPPSHHLAADKMARRFLELFLLFKSEMSTSVPLNFKICYHSLLQFTLCWFDIVPRQFVLAGCSQNAGEHAFSWFTFFTPTSAPPHLTLSRIGMSCID